MIVVAIHNTTDMETKTMLAKVLNDDKQALIGALHDRLGNLKPFLYSAIDAVEAHLGIEEAVPAAERTFAAGPVGYVG